ncbi:hypothetical protein [Streptomyces sp. Ac-502]|uniref:hypothetical protein n=1 Tax=Streptomyces sp. Ac-502 TaxID=3342801 RepID=UPI003862629A
METCYGLLLVAGDHMGERVAAVVEDIDYVRLLMLAPDVTVPAAKIIRCLSDWDWLGLAPRPPLSGPDEPGARGRASGLPALGACGSGAGDVPDEAPQRGHQRWTVAAGGGLQQLGGHDQQGGPDQGPRHPDVHIAPFQHVGDTMFTRGSRVYHAVTPVTRDRRITLAVSLFCPLLGDQDENRFWHSAPDDGLVRTLNNWNALRRAVRRPASYCRREGIPIRPLARRSAARG